MKKNDNKKKQTKIVIGGKRITRLGDGRKNVTSKKWREICGGMMRKKLNK